ncbi:uncharacterized protein LOC126304749 [Schistocerca gregaria]|uniref:uncharacterized protein LOC126304749 n=1 Tax=Schistocerca gregaria TaxID=7010 RepID=UPI00211EEC17|nr:uncharacterized protein LOC126304749 [Schistocerca gregaria]
MYCFMSAKGKPGLRRGKSPSAAAPSARAVVGMRRVPPCARSKSSSAQSREVDHADVVIVGAGPAGLSASIRIKQLCRERGKDLRVCVLEKGSQVGSHCLSGAVLDPVALNELFPNWKDMGAPLVSPVVQDRFFWLTSSRAIPLPVITAQKNHGNYVISIAELTRWLARQAEELDVEIYPGFPASGLLYNEAGQVVGVVTGDQGIDRHGNRTSEFQPGMELRAPITLLAEGARGSLSKEAVRKFGLAEKPVQHQTYGLGLKELWEVQPSKFKQGLVTHTMGWPMNLETWAGSFVYHWRDNLVSLGYVVALDYKNPYLSPYQEFQRWKQHPSVRSLLERGRCVEYGARALNEGGFQSIPRLTFPGGALIGCAAGFLNVPRIKGNHTAMKSGMVAAEAVFNALSKSADEGQQLSEYPELLRNSWVHQELYRYRNVRPSFRYGILPGILYTGLDWLILKGREPWTLSHGTPDHAKTKKAANCRPILYPKPDNTISFDLLTNLQRSGTNHNENQPPHLKILNKETPLQVNYKDYAGLESRYCPAGVYEYIDTPTPQGTKPRFQINAQNCLHCKTCDIKDPTQNIKWVPPEGGGGPNYANL